MSETNAGHDKVARIKIEQHPAMGGLWIAACVVYDWIPTSQFWRGVLAIMLWPYYLGTHFSFLAR